MSKEKGIYRETHEGFAVSVIEKISTELLSVLGSSNIMRNASLRIESTSILSLIQFDYYRTTNES